jgi:hypothetical protein
MMKKLSSTVASLTSFLMNSKNKSFLLSWSSSGFQLLL